MDPSAAVCEHPQVVLALLAVLILVVVFLLYKMYYKKSSSSGLANVKQVVPSNASANPNLNKVKWSTESTQSNVPSVAALDHLYGISAQGANNMEKMIAARSMKKVVWGPDVTQEVETLASAGAILDVGCGSAYDPMLDSAYTGPNNVANNMMPLANARSK